VREFKAFAPAPGPIHWHLAPQQPTRKFQLIVNPPCVWKLSKSRAFIWHCEYHMIRRRRSTWVGITARTATRRYPLSGFQIQRMPLPPMLQQ
jgi:hypothetical protein